MADELHEVIRNMVAYKVYFHLNISRGNAKVTIIKKGDVYVSETGSFEYRKKTECPLNMIDLTGWKEFVIRTSEDEIVLVIPMSVLPQEDNAKLVKQLDENGIAVVNQRMLAYILSKLEKDLFHNTLHDISGMRRMRSTLFREDSEYWDTGSRSYYVYYHPKVEKSILKRLEAARIASFKQYTKK